jgi:hypothetical protein
VDTVSRVDVNRSVSRSSSALWPGVAALLCCSCSVIGVKRQPSDPEPGDAPDCTSSYTLPLVDFGSAVLSGSGAVVLHGQASSERDEPDGGSSKTFRNLAWSATGLAVLFIASGAYGSHQVQRCRGAQMGAGIAPVEGPNPNWQEESKPGPGQRGATCKQDSDCGEDFVCDEPMRTCIAPPMPPSDPTPPAPPPETTEPATPPADAGPSPTP